jgi:hypothetical protein
VADDDGEGLVGVEGLGDAGVGRSVISDGLDQDVVGRRFEDVGVVEVEVDRAHCFSSPASDTTKSSGDVIGTNRLVMVCAAPRIWCKISLTNSMSYIDGFLFDSLLEEGVHLIPIPHDIDWLVQQILQFLLDADQGQQIRLSKFHYNVNITGIDYFIPGHRAKHTDARNAKFVLFSLSKSGQGLQNLVTSHQIFPNRKT